uniref:Secreted protein n=1 Tax=Parascaris univalens TaxID=6257 RepID=A0A915B914_PARUN
IGVVCKDALTAVIGQRVFASVPHTYIRVCEHHRGEQRQPYRQDGRRNAANHRANPRNFSPAVGDFYPRQRL